MECLMAFFNVKNIFSLSVLGLLLIQPLKSNAAYSNYPRNCLNVKYTAYADGGMLCIESLEKLDSRQTQAGDQFNAYFYIGSRLDRNVNPIPLKVTLIKPFGVDRYQLDITTYLSGANNEYQIQIYFSAQTRNGLPYYSQGSGRITSRAGSQIIDKYVWDESNIQPQPHECVAKPMHKTPPSDAFAPACQGRRFRRRY